LTAARFGDKENVSTKERPVHRRAEAFPQDGQRWEKCAVCGVTVETKDIEDTNGWRWFNDGHGGLLPLCPTCPLPEQLLVD